MATFIICACVWACVASICGTVVACNVSANRARASIENAKTLAIEARVAADREGV